MIECEVYCTAFDSSCPAPPFPLIYLLAEDEIELELVFLALVLMLGGTALTGAEEIPFDVRVDARLRLVGVARRVSAEELLSLSVATVF